MRKWALVFAFFILASHAWAQDGRIDIDPSTLKIDTSSGNIELNLDGKRIFDRKTYDGQERSAIKAFFTALILQAKQSNRKISIDLQTLSSLAHGNSLDSRFPELIKTVAVVDDSKSLALCNSALASTKQALIDLNPSVSGNRSLKKEIATIVEELQKVQAASAN